MNLYCFNQIGQYKFFYYLTIFIILFQIKYIVYSNIYMSKLYVINYNTKNKLYKTIYNIIIYIFLFF